MWKPDCLRLTESYQNDMNPRIKLPLENNIPPYQLGTLVRCELVRWTTNLHTQLRRFVSRKKKWTCEDKKMDVSKIFSMTKGCSNKLDRTRIVVMLQTQVTVNKIENMSN